MAQDEIRLRCGPSETIAAPFGAELVAWRVDGRELLWRPDPEFWDRTSPVLFPVVGWSRDGKIGIDGVSHPMPVHGFAANSLFEIESRDEASVVFLLRDNAGTRRHYPFSFELRVSYRLLPSAVFMDLSVLNSGAAPLPYALGVHPGFAMPFAGGALEDYRVEFEFAENPDVPVIAPGGLFSQATRRISLEGRILPLSRATFAQEAMCFLNARSSSVSLVRPGHGRLSLRAGNLPHLAVWSMADAPFVCLEAWSSHGDRVGFSGDVTERPGMRLLDPGETGRCSAELAFAADA